MYCLYTDVCTFQFPWSPIPRLWLTRRTLALSGGSGSMEARAGVGRRGWSRYPGGAGGTRPTVLGEGAVASRRGWMRVLRGQRRALQLDLCAAAAG
jgi:hypothetical protein